MDRVYMDYWPTWRTSHRIICKWQQFFKSLEPNALSVKTICLIIATSSFLFQVVFGNFWVNFLVTLFIISKILFHDIVSWSFSLLSNQQTFSFDVSPQSRQSWGRRSCTNKIESMQEVKSALMFSSLVMLHYWF